MKSYHGPITQQQKLHLRKMALLQADHTIISLTIVLLQMKRNKQKHLLKRTNSH